MNGEKLQALSTDSSLWPEDADAPSAWVMQMAENIFHQLADEKLVPTEIVASAEGGVAFCFVAGDKYADIECLNSGNLLGVITNRSDRPIVWEIDQSTTGITQACEKISQFLNPPPANK